MIKYFQNIFANSTTKEYFTPAIFKENLSFQVRFYRELYLLVFTPILRQILIATTCWLKRADRALRCVLRLPTSAPKTNTTPQIGMTFGEIRFPYTDFRRFTFRSFVIFKFRSRGVSFFPLRCIRSRRCSRMLDDATALGKNSDSREITPVWNANS